MSDFNKFEKYLRLLTQLNNIPEAKNVIDNFFFFHVKNVNNIPDNMHYRDFEELVADSFRDLKNELSTKYNIEEEAFSVYFSMDLDLFPKIDESDTRNFEIYFKFDLDNDLSLSLNGRNIEEAYEYAVEEAVRFLQNNIELLPKSTQKFINSKKAIFDNFKFINIPSLDNDFHTKAFANALSSSPDINDLAIYLRRFSASCNNSIIDKSTLHFNFFQALEIKYKEVKNEDFINYKQEVFDIFFEQFSRMKDDYGVRVDYKNLFDSFLKKICQNDSALDFAFNSIKKNNYLKFCKIFDEFVRNDEDKECLDSVFLYKLSRKFNSELIVFDKLPTNTQHELICQSKKHYYENDKGVEVYVHEIPEIDISEDEIPF